MKIIFIAWSPYNRRSDLLAQKLCARSYFVHYLQRGRLLQLPVRYLVQGLRTLQILCHERPDMIFVQNPPIFCVLLAFVYSRLCGARYVIDSHTGAFLSRGWRWSLPLHKLLSRRSVTTIVTNNYLRRRVEEWGAHALVIGYIPSEYPPGEPFELNGIFNLAVVSTFAPDEPLALIFDAAAQLPDVHFYVTGDPGRAPSNLLERRPQNVSLTGYIAYSQYIGLLRDADAVLDLTMCDHTLLLGAFEAVALGTPLIISDWPILREYFSKGAIHVPNTVAGICEGIRRMQRERDSLRRDIRVLQAQLQEEWAPRSRDLWRLLST